MTAEKQDNSGFRICCEIRNTVAEAYGVLGAVPAEAEISRESSYRALSPEGNPTLKTLLAVLKMVWMRLSVEPEDHALA